MNLRRLLPVKFWLNAESEIHFDELFVSWIEHSCERSITIEVEKLVHILSLTNYYQLFITFKLLTDAAAYDLKWGDDNWKTGIFSITSLGTHPLRDKLDRLVGKSEVLFREKDVP